MIVRKALIDDASTVAAHIRDLFLELGHTPPLASFDESVTLCRQVLEKGEYTVFLAIPSNGLADGILSLSEGVSIYAGGRFGIIREFYVVPEMRSRGIGKALWEKVKEFSRDRGWTRIEVTPPSKKEHIRSYNFYAKQGFREIGPRLKYEDSYT